MNLFLVRNQLVEKVWQIGGFPRKLKNTVTQQKHV
jgi:hypothetical protein